MMEFYMNYVEEPDASEKKYYGCLAKEQLNVVNIMVILVQYYASEFDIAGLDAGVEQLLELMNQSKFLGIFSSKWSRQMGSISREPVLQDYMHQLENMSTLLVLCAIKMPGECEFCVDDDSTQVSLAVKNFHLPASSDLSVKPGFMFLKKKVELLKRLETQFKSVIWRMAECQSSLLQKSHELKDHLDDQAVWKQLDQVQKTYYTESKNYSQQLMLVKRLHQQTIEVSVRLNQTYLVYAAKKVIQQWVSYFILVTFHFAEREQDKFDGQTLIKCAHLLKDLVKDNNLFVDQFWTDYDHNYRTAFVLLLDLLKKDYQLMPCLTYLLGSDHCVFGVPKTNYVDNVLRFIQDTDGFWDDIVLATLVKLALGKYRPSYCQSNVTNILGKRPNASMEFYES